MNFLLKKVAALCLCYGFQFDVVWVPTLGNPADAPSREQPLSSWRNALPGLPPVPPARLLSQQAENELRQLAEPFSANPCVQGERGCPPSSRTRPSLAASAFSAASSVWPDPRYVQCRCSSPATSPQGKGHNSLFFCSNVPPVRAQCRARRQIPIASSRCRQRQRLNCDSTPRASLKLSFC